MPQLGQTWPTKARGATLVWKVTFFDAFGRSQSPSSAQVVISYVRDSDKTTQQAIVPMSNTGPGGSWVAQWDSRGASPGVVYWSVETPGTPPVSVEDGQLTLEANAANQVTF